MKRALLVMSALLLACLGLSMTAGVASAHTPAISADCSGVHVSATSYDAGRANTWTVTVAGVTQSGTFGESFDRTFAVPQAGATTPWSARIAAYDGAYDSGVQSGNVGPCGAPPPPPPPSDVCADLPGNQPPGTDCTPTPPPPPPPSDVCADLPGNQPPGTDCTPTPPPPPPPSDVCADLPGNQPPGTDCTPTPPPPPPPSDVCADLPGNQPPGTECTPPPTTVRTDSGKLHGCDIAFQGKKYGAGDLTYDEAFEDTYVFNTSTSTWDLVTDTTGDIGNVEFTQWTKAQQIQAGCVEKPGSDTIVKGAEATPRPQPSPAPVAVPTVIDAGLAGATIDQRPVASRDGSPFGPASALVGAGAVLMLAAGIGSRRRSRS